MELCLSLGGTVYLFAGGTGLLPYLDFLDYLLKKAIFAVCSKNNIEIVNLYNEDYVNTFLSDLKVVLVAAFAVKEDFVGFKTIKKLLDISQENELNLFDMIIKLDKGKIEGVQMWDSHFDMKFMMKHVNTNKVSRVYVCGPPKMNRNVPKSLERIGVSKSKIIVV
jgi:NAD(P)H-flavin reductase